MLTFLAAVCGCGERAFDNCASTNVEAISRGETGSMNNDVFVRADDRGWIVIWGFSNFYESGVFAWRPGASAVNVSPGVDAAKLSIADVEGGWLICWSSNSFYLEQPPATGCFHLDYELAAGPTTVNEIGRVRGLGRIGGALHAIVNPDPNYPTTVVLVPIDDDGAALSSGIAHPCGGTGHHVAWSNWGLACLRPSDPACGLPGEPPDCTYQLDLHRADGTLIWSVPEVAPFGAYLTRVDVRVAASADGFLVGWEGWNVRAISPAGAVLWGVDEPVGQAASIAAVPGGWAVLWSEDLADVPGPYPMPRIMLLAADGSVRRAPSWLVEPTAPYVRQYGATAFIGISEVAFAVAWQHFGGETNGYSPGLLFRALGCEP